jgi:hypothetical protein
VNLCRPEATRGTSPGVRCAKPEAQPRVLCHGELGLLLTTVWCVAPVCTAIIWHIRLPISSVAVDHPGHGIADGSCHEEREQRVSRYIPGHKSLPLTNIAMSLRLALTCLPHVVVALAVHAPGCFRGTPGNVVERLPHLIQNLLG